MRLVDEDAVIERIIEIKGENIAPGAFPMYSIWKTIFAQVPTIEAEPVRRGRWELIDDIKPTAYRCSICNKVSACEWGYCPYCGAKMDGGEERWNK